MDVFGNMLIELINAQQKKEEEEFIVPRQTGGKSKWIEARGTSGFFDFDVPPKIDSGVPSPMYLFETEDGEAYWQPLEKKYQGGRWEDAEHAEGDWLRYLGYTPEERQSKMVAMWGETPLSEELLGLLNTGASFEQMKEAVKEYDTWRSISYGEPGE